MSFTTPSNPAVLRLRGPGDRPLSLRGGGIYDHRAGTLLDTATEVTAWVELPYDLLPEPARAYVQAEGRRRALAEQGAPATQIAEAQRRAQEAMFELRRLQTSTQRSNVGFRPSVQYKALGQRGVVPLYSKVPIR